MQIPLTSVKINVRVTTRLPLISFVLLKSMGRGLIIYKHSSYSPPVPSGPFFPSRPGSPVSPFAPFIPLSPDNPGFPRSPREPCSPILPGKPRDPGSPSSPARPLNEQQKIITFTVLLRINARGVY